jgi:AcrR family transcriptional regulator
VNGAETSPTGAPRRARRAPGEIHDLILDAARQSFNERGYARATTRDIAARADVNETLLFRNFGSKANLFAEAVLEPMADFLRQWLELTDPDTDAVMDVIQERFTDSLYASVTENRGMLLTFFATSVFEPEVLAGHAATAHVEAALDELADACEERLVRLGVDTAGMDVRISARGTIAMILAMALFEEWLLPHGAHRPSRTEVVEELTRQILYGGFNERPDTFRENTGSPSRRTRAASSRGRS